jgi:Tol biopolymer transport system component
MTIGNTKWTPDGQHFLIAMWVRPKPQVRRSIYVANREGSAVRWLTYFSHHHSWALGGKCVLFNDCKIHEEDGTRKEPRMHLIDFDGSNRRVLIDEPVGSHPLMDPTGTKVADFDREGIYLVWVDEQRIERLAEFRAPFDMTHGGTHPHCVWNYDGTQILYNSAETGHSEIYLIRMDD